MALAVDYIKASGYSFGSGGRVQNVNADIGNKYLIRTTLSQGTYCDEFNLGRFLREAQCPITGNYYPTTSGASVNAFLTVPSTSSNDVIVNILADIGNSGNFRVYGQEIYSSSVPVYPVVVGYPYYFGYYTYFYDYWSWYWYSSQTNRVVIDNEYYGVGRSYTYNQDEFRTIDGLYTEYSQSERDALKNLDKLEILSREPITWAFYDYYPSGVNVGYFNATASHPLMNGAVSGELRGDRPTFLATGPASGQLEKYPYIDAETVIPYYSLGKVVLDIQNHLNNMFENPKTNTSYYHPYFMEHIPCVTENIPFDGGDSYIAFIENARGAGGVWVNDTSGPHPAFPAGYGYVFENPDYDLDTNIVIMESFNSRYFRTPVPIAGIIGDLDHEYTGSTTTIINSFKRPVNVPFVIKSHNGQISGLPCPAISRAQWLKINNIYENYTEFLTEDNNEDNIPYNLDRFPSLNQLQQIYSPNSIVRDMFVKASEIYVHNDDYENENLLEDNVSQLGRYIDAEGRLDFLYCSLYISTLKKKEFTIEWNCDIGQTGTIVAKDFHRLAGSDDEWIEGGRTFTYTVRPYFTLALLNTWERRDSYLYTKQGILLARRNEFTGSRVITKEECSPNLFTVAWLSDSTSDQQSFMDTGLDYLDPMDGTTPRTYIAGTNMVTDLTFDGNDHSMLLNGVLFYLIGRPTITGEYTPVEGHEFKLRTTEFSPPSVGDCIITIDGMEFRAISNEGQSRLEINNHSGKTIPLRVSCQYEYQDIDITINRDEVIDESVTSEEFVDAVYDGFDFNVDYGKTGGWTPPEVPWGGYFPSYFPYWLGPFGSTSWFS